MGFPAQNSVEKDNRTCSFLFAVVIVVVILILYAFYAGASFRESVDEIAYGTSCFVTTLSVIVIPLTMYKMSTLTFKVCKTSWCHYGMTYL